MTTTATSTALSTFQLLLHTVLTHPSSSFRPTAQKPDLLDLSPLPVTIPQDGRSYDINGDRQQLAHTPISIGICDSDTSICWRRGRRANLSDRRPHFRLRRCGRATAKRICNCTWCNRDRVSDESATATTVTIAIATSTATTHASRDAHHAVGADRGVKQCGVAREHPAQFSALARGARNRFR
jgi:hypothetical protein